MLYLLFIEICSTNFRKTIYDSSVTTCDSRHQSVSLTYPLTRVPGIIIVTVVTPGYPGTRVVGTPGTGSGMSVTVSLTVRCDYVLLLLVLA
eukprot:2048077-Rhodomonas_salina.1